MAQHTIELSEEAYELLLKQAARLQLSPERVLDQVVLDALAFAPSEDTTEIKSDIATTSIVEALAAIERMSNLFGDVSIEDLEQHLNDPMLTLMNAEIESLIR